MEALTYFLDFPYWVSAGGSKTYATFTAILCSESSLSPIAEASTWR